MKIRICTLFLALIVILGLMSENFYLSTVIMHQQTTIRELMGIPTRPMEN
jgi:hypothetical protein